jgi:hypothetical protein
MNSLKLGKTGYGFILSKKGTFIYSHREDWVKEQKTIFQIISQAYKPEKLRVPAQKALKGSKIEMDFQNPLTGQSSWIFFEPIPTTSWTLSAVFIQDEILLNTKSLHHKLLLINLQIISFFFFLFILIFRAYKGSVRSL